MRKRVTNDVIRYNRSFAVPVPASTGFEEIIIVKIVVDIIFFIVEIYKIQYSDQRYKEIIAKQRVTMTQQLICSIVE